ncbi:MAG: hypothetical protein M1822_003451 [Bathelium mastoideum]|nr:MAG: hypothetical protein M1822_003451 [Bathelium mastoideum]
MSTATKFASSKAANGSLPAGNHTNLGGLSDQRFPLDKLPLEVLAMIMEQDIFTLGRLVSANERAKEYYLAHPDSTLSNCLQAYPSRARRLIPLVLEISDWDYLLQKEEHFPDHIYPSPGQTRQLKFFSYRENPFKQARAYDREYQSSVLEYDRDRKLRILQNAVDIFTNLDRTADSVFKSMFSDSGNLSDVIQLAALAMPPMPSERDRVLTGLLYLRLLASDASPCKPTFLNANHPPTSWEIDEMVSIMLLCHMPYGDQLGRFLSWKFESDPYNETRKLWARLSSMETLILRNPPDRKFNVKERWQWAMKEAEKRGELGPNLCWRLRMGEVSDPAELKMLAWVDNEDEDDEDDNLSLEDEEFGAEDPWKNGLILWDKERFRLFSWFMEDDKGDKN